MLKRNLEATEARHFACKRSYVALDGREVCNGKDWRDRVWELAQRAKFKCERPGCPDVMYDPHHIVKRSKGRDDRLSNLIALCRRHHREAHPEKQVKWSKR